MTFQSESNLPTVAQIRRDEILAGPRDAAAHAHLLASLPFATELDWGMARGEAIAISLRA